MNRNLTTRLCGIALAGVFLLAGDAMARQTPQTPAPDNTAANKQDRKEGEPNADQAKNTANDRQIMQQIRKDVMADKNLSTYAHNVKIISKHGKVTLKGPVHSEEEKKTVAEYAQKVAGEGNVTDQLTVKMDRK